MKIYKVMRFRDSGWNEWHDEEGTFSTREEAQQHFDKLGLKYNPSGTYWPGAYTSYILEEEID